MKKSLWLLSLLGILVLSGCGWPNVVEYNDSFVAIVKECTDANQTLFQTYQADWTSIDSILDAVQTNINTCNNASTKATQMWDFEKDSSMKDAVVELLNAEVDYLEKFAATSRYRNIDNLTDEDRMAYDWLVSDLNQSQLLINQQFTNLQDIQEAFAVKHGLKLEQ